MLKGQPRTKINFFSKKNMRKQELIKKTCSELVELLKSIELPDVELKSHKSRLRLALLNSKYFQKKRSLFWIKTLVPTGAFLTLVILFGVLVVNPKLMEAKAINIVQEDPQMQELMQWSGAIIKEVKVKGERGYVLLTVPEEKLLPQVVKGPRFVLLPEMVEGGAEIPEFFAGSVVEVNLKTKMVDRIQSLTDKNIPVPPLTREEEARAIEIIQKEPVITKMVPAAEKAQAEIEAGVEDLAKFSLPVAPSFIVKLLPPLKLHLETDDSQIKVLAEPGEDRMAGVILQVGQEQHVIRVNLSQEKAEALIQE